MNKDQRDIGLLSKDGYVIINQYGHIWHSDGLFETPQDAVHFLKNFWRNVPQFKLKNWMIAPANMTIAVKTVTSQAQMIPAEDVT